MIRVLQVVERAVDQQTQIAVEQLATISGLQSDVLAVQTELPLCIREAAAMRWQRPEVHLIHAWGDTALKISAFASSLPLVFSPTRHPDDRMIRWLNAIRHHRSVDVAAPTETARRALVERGVPIERCHHVPAGVDFSRIDPSGRSELRRRLGYSDENRVLLAVGESTRATDHERAAWATVILHVLERRYRLLIWGRGPMTESVRRFAGKLGDFDLLTIAMDHLGNDVRFEQLTAAADIALVTNRDAAPTLPIAICMAAGLPIVSVTDSTICELLEDRHNALLCPSRRPRLIARRILDLEEDSDGQRMRTNQGRAEVYERYSKARFKEAMMTLYRSAARPMS
ncbi:MAG: glycosyltransferase [Phycisphaerae bacterium]|nr:glycosyltransferase [Phycisphaerae bacterium]